MLNPMHGSENNSGDAEVFEDFRKEKEIPAPERWDFGVLS